MAETKGNYNKALIERGLNATENAIELIREGDIIRKSASLELRDVHLSMHEDLDQIRGMIKEFEGQIQKEKDENSKWMDRKIEKSKASVNQALSSTLMMKDVQLLEKKVNILKESVIQVNKAYYNYSKEVNMDELTNQVVDMVYRTEKEELEALRGVMTDEKSIEEALRGAIEGLYGLKSSNPKVMEEARLLASDLRIFRDAAANKNFYAMISKSSTDGRQGSADSQSASSERSYSNSSSQSKDSAFSRSATFPATNRETS